VIYQQGEALEQDSAMDDTFLRKETAQDVERVQSGVEGLSLLGPHFLRLINRRRE
jgi:hypothetical protein